MLAAITVFLIGAGLTALGIVQPLLYVIGIVVLIIAFVGLAVRLGDAVRWLLR